MTHSYIAIIFPLYYDLHSIVFHRDPYSTTLDYIPSLCVICVQLRACEWRNKDTNGSVNNSIEFIIKGDTLFKYLMYNMYLLWDVFS